jgi:N-acetylneuraminic acid mutarotase
MNIIRIKFFCLLLMAFAVITSCGSDEEEELVGNWTTLGSFDGDARGDATGFVIGDTAYICMGYNAKAKALSDLWRYTPGMGWEKRAEFRGKPRYAAVSFSIGEKAYVGLGFDGKDVFKDFWEYDPRRNQWDSVTAEFPGVARYYAVAAAVGNKGYVGTGTDGGSPLKDFYSFTPGTTPGTGTWTSIRSYEGSKRSGASVFVIGNYLYLLGGTANDGNPVDFRKYDPGTDKWSKVIETDLRNTDLTSDDDKYGSIPRAYASTFVINGKGYITLGQTTMALSSTYEFDPSANTWTERTPFSRSTRSFAVSFSLNNRGFVMTGRSGSSTRFDDFFEFFPATANNEYDD